MTKQTGKFTENQILILVLILGFAVRVLFSFTNLSMIYPDEQFQVIEPAGFIINNVGWLSWEWYYGVRSWFVPGLLMPLLWVLKTLGITKGPALIIACKVFTSLFFLASVYFIDKILRRFSISFLSRLTALSILSFFPTYIIWSTTTFSETFAQFFMWVGFYYIYEAHFEERKRFLNTFLAGLFMGLAFVCRIQMFPIFFGTLIYFIYKNRNYFLFKTLATGFFLAVILLGLLDWVTWGQPFHSIITNIRMNIFQGVADMNGVSPWYFYFQEILKNFGLATICISVVVVFSNIKKVIKKTELLFLIIPMAFFFILHIAIAHKELRFISPLFALIPVLIAVAVGVTSKVKQRILFFLILAGIIISNIADLASGKYKLPLINGELSEISKALYEDSKDRKISAICMIETYWIWTRGNVMLGQNPVITQIPIQEYRNEVKKLHCDYFIVASRYILEIERLAKSNNIYIERVSEDSFQNILYRYREKQL